MNDKLLNINVNQEGQSIKVGNDVIELVDRSKSTFKAESIYDLKTYLGDDAITIREPYQTEYVPIKPEQLIGFFTERRCVFYLKQGVDRYTTPVGESKIQLSNDLQLLNSMNMQTMHIDDFTLRLKKIKKRLDGAGLLLLDSLVNLKLKKILTIDKTSDNRGNFGIAVKSEKAAKEDYEFPEKIDITVPLFASADSSKIEISFDFSFNWAMQDEKVKLECSLSNLNLSVEIGELISKEIKEVFTGYKLYCGELNIVQQTDEWKYKKNNLEIRGI